MYIPGTAVNVCVPACLKNPAGFVPSPNVVPEICMFTLSKLAAAAESALFPFHVTVIKPAPPTTSPDPKLGSDGTVADCVTNVFTELHAPSVPSLFFHLN